VIARFGGDEFIILLPEVKDLQQVIDVARRILNELSIPFILNAMYKSKEVKGSKFTVFQPVLDKEIQEHFRIKNNLRHAINKNELYLNYQPIYGSSTEKVIGTEALLRWTYEGSKNISPAKFIPIAEKSGEIYPIGE